MSSDSPPHLRIVSERSSREIQQERRLADLRWRLVSLTANLLRVTRGAGRPWEVMTQCIETARAYQAYLEEVGCLPSSFEVAEILRFNREWGEFSSEADIDYGRSMMVAGALQFVASSLLDQRTQVAAGRREMAEGEQMVVEARLRIRAERAAEERAARKSVRPPTKKAKAKRRAAPKP